MNYGYYHDEDGRWCQQKVRGNRGRPRRLPADALRPPRMSAPPANEEAWQNFLENYQEKESESDDKADESTEDSNLECLNDISQDKVIVQGTMEVIPANATGVSFNNISLTRVLEEH